jgi:hypothetical protein
MSMERQYYLNQLGVPDSLNQITNYEPLPTNLNFNLNPDPYGLNMNANQNIDKVQQLKNNDPYYVDWENLNNPLNTAAGNKNIFAGGLNFNIDYHTAIPESTGVSYPMPGGQQGSTTTDYLKNNEQKYSHTYNVPPMKTPTNNVTPAPEPPKYERSGDYGDRNDYKMAHNEDYSYGPLNRLMRWGGSGLKKESEDDFYAREEEAWNKEQALKNQKPSNVNAGNVATSSFNPKKFDPNAQNSREDIMAMQKEIGTKVDGDWGPNSKKAYSAWQEQQWYPGKHAKNLVNKAKDFRQGRKDDGKWYLGKHLSNAWKNSRLGGGRGLINPSADPDFTNPNTGLPYTDDENMPMNDPNAMFKPEPQSPVINKQPNKVNTGSGAWDLAQNSLNDMEKETNQSIANQTQSLVFNDPNASNDKGFTNPLGAAANNTQAKLDLDKPIDLSKEGYAHDMKVSKGQTVIHRGKKYKYTGPDGALMAKIGPFNRNTSGMWESEGEIAAKEAKANKKPETYNIGGQTYKMPSREELLAHQRFVNQMKGSY